MKNEFVTYEQALALKELGFDEPCFGYYNTNTQGQMEHKLIEGLLEWFDERTQPKNSDLHHSKISAPLYQQAFRWFREKHDIHCEFFVDDNKTFGFLISQFVDDGRIDKPIQRKYLDYEEAEQVCLNELIKIVKNV